MVEVPGRVRPGVEVLIQKIASPEKSYAHPDLSGYLCDDRARVRGVIPWESPAWVGCGVCVTATLQVRRAQCFSSKVDGAQPLPEGKGGRTLGSRPW